MAARGKNMSYGQNLELLKKMQLMKTQLFGQFSSKLTDDEIKAAWSALYEWTRERGFPCARNGFDALKKNTWQSLRRKAIVRCFISFLIQIEYLASS